MLRSEEFHDGLPAEIYFLTEKYMGNDGKECTCNKTSYSPRMYDVLYTQYGERVGIITSIIIKEKSKGVLDGTGKEVLVELNP